LGSIREKKKGEKGGGAKTHYSAIWNEGGPRYDWIASGLSEPRYVKTWPFYGSKRSAFNDGKGVKEKEKGWKEAEHRDRD